MTEYEPTEMRLEHFKCSYDPAWNYQAIAESIFDGPRILVVAEKMDVNAHVHFQGYTNLSRDTFDKRLTALAATHYKRKHNPKCRPVLRHKRTCDERGFQYISKELDDQRDPLFSRGFSDEELHALWSASTALVDKLKTGLGDYLKSKPFKGLTPKDIHLNLARHAADYLKENDIKGGRHTKYNILNAMLTHPDATPDTDVWATLHF